MPTKLARVLRKKASRSWLLTAIIVVMGGGCQPATTLEAGDMTLTPSAVVNNSEHPGITVSPEPESGTVTPTQPTPVESQVGEATVVTSSETLPLTAWGLNTPQPILSGQAIHLAGWLPDSQRLLITRRNADDQGRALIEIVNLKGQQVMTFGTWYISPSMPVIYSAAEEAVVFIGYEDENPSLPALIAVDKSESATLISGETESFGALPNGTKLWIINAQQSILVVPSLNSAIEGHLNDSRLSLARITTQGGGSEDKGYQFPWSIKVNPGDPDQAIIFNNSSFLLADLSSSSLTEISLGEEKSERASGKYWALDAQWSPDGRQIVANTTVGQPITGFSNLTLLDTTTWQYHRIEIPGIAISGMSWFPDSQNVLLRVTNNLREGIAIGRLHALNAVSLDIQPLNIFPDDLANSYGANILWSPDGQEIATPCSA